MSKNPTDSPTPNTPSASNDGPDFDAFFAAILERWGGMEGFAERFVECYDATKPGSATRGSLMLKMLDCVYRHKKDFGEPPKFEEMDDEDLEKLVLGMLTKPQKGAGDGAE